MTSPLSSSSMKMIIIIIHTILYINIISIHILQKHYFQKREVRDMENYDMQLNLTHSSRIKEIQKNELQHISRIEENKCILYYNY